MKLKRVLALLTAAVMVVGLAACGNGDTSKGSSNPGGGGQTSGTQGGGGGQTSNPGSQQGSGDMASSITLWTYPIGDWNNEAKVKALTDAFKTETGIDVSVEYLTYSDGDNTVNAALTAGNAPDLIMEGPERLVANWGAGGHMVDLSDMLDDTDKSEINAVNPGILTACTTSDGKVYEYPLVMTAHCMAVNLDAFKAAGADQYLNLDTHTWTTQNFIDAMNAMYSHYNTPVGAVFCKDQGGDQGTRALVNNLYGGTFTNAEHTAYTWSDPKNIQALELLAGMDALDFDPSLAGGDEIREFYNGTLQMAFCWNIAQQLDPNSAGTGSGKTAAGDEIAFMSFPSETGESLLQGGIWGFGVFNNGDQARISAAKEFIRFICDSEHTVDAVKTARYFAVRTSAGEGTDLTGIWADDEIMNEYTKLMPFLGDYYQVTSGWTQARAEWWNMLQEVGFGEDVSSSVASHCDAANTAASGG